ncbi:MAG: YdcH family protein [Amphiplicatus sp.]
MATSAHLDTLTQRHQELEAEIASEMKHPSHDEYRITELKRQKLKIKDQMETIRIRKIAH